MDAITFTSLLVAALGSITKAMGSPIFQSSRITDTQLDERYDEETGVHFQYAAMFESKPTTQAGQVTLSTLTITSLDTETGEVEFGISGKIDTSLINDSVFRFDFARSFVPNKNGEFGDAVDNWLSEVVDKVCSVASAQTKFFYDGANDVRRAYQ